MCKVALFLTWALWAGLGFGAPVHLFTEDGAQVENYRVLLEALQEGDTLHFPDGRSFVFQGNLGNGYTTQVMRVTLPGGTEELALRVPANVGRVSGRPFPAYVDHTLDGFEELRGSRVPMARVYGGARGQYVLAELIPHRLNGWNFLHMLDDPAFARREGYTPAQLRRLEEAMVRFAGTTTEFSHIGDFKPDQLVFNEARGEWVLLDWMSGSRPAEALSEGYQGIFSDTFQLKGSHPHAEAFIERLRGEVRLRMRPPPGNQRPVIPRASRMGSCFARVIGRLLPIRP